MRHPKTLGKQNVYYQFHAGFSQERQFGFGKKTNEEFLISIIDVTYVVY